MLKSQCELFTSYKASIHSSRWGIQTRLLVYKISNGTSSNAGISPLIFLYLMPIPEFTTIITNGSARTLIESKKLHTFRITQSPVQFMESYFELNRKNLYYFI